MAAFPLYHRPAFALALILLVTACSDTETKNTATLNAALNDATTNGAAGEADGTPPSGSRTGAAPVRLSPMDAHKEALRLAGGKLMRTPATTKEITSTKEPVTLGGLAEQKRGDGACTDARVSYDMGWAARMPAAFPVYPGGQVTEAAGSDRSPCGLRAASFTTPVAPDEVMDFYYTMARRAGYSAEHIEQNGAHVLGGTRERDENAFHVSFTALHGGGTAVDLIATGGR